MADKLPYFHWYPKDAETDEAYSSMTDQELGFYHRCLNRSWLNDGLPAALPDMARALGKQLAYVEKMWRTVGSRFVLSVDSRWVNPRQEIEREVAINKSSKASRSANRRWEGNAKAMPTHSEGNARASGSVSGSSGEIQEKEKTSTRARVFPPGYEFDEQYAEFRAALKSWGAPIIDPEDFIGWAWKEWGKLDAEQRLAAINGVRQRELEGADPAFCRSPERFLKGREWKRPIVAPRAPKSRLERMMDSI